MESNLWNQKFCDRGKNPVTMELKVVLFLFLMTRETDYGWNITKRFKEAIEASKWTDRRGLGDLKYGNKVESALGQMEKSGLIFKYSDLIKHTPLSSFSSSKMEAEVRDNPRRNYYSINPRVFRYSSDNTDTADYNEGNVSFNVELLGNSTIYRGLQILQNYKKDDMEIIALINRLPVFDYLTILTTMLWICRDARAHCSGYAPIDGDDSKTPSFFNNPKKFMELLKKYSSEWNIGHTDNMDGFFKKFDRELEGELAKSVYNERTEFA
jgi:hypothetical protein